MSSLFRTVLAVLVSWTAFGDDARAVVLPAGALDPTFGKCGVIATAGDTYLWDRVALQPDGKIVTSRQRRLARYDPVTGALDPTFGTNGIFTHAFPFASGSGDLVVQPDGRILLPWARLRSDGTVDVVFPPGLLQAEVVGRQSSGAIVIAGMRTDAVGRAIFALVRLDDQGALDPSFGAQGIVETEIAPSDPDPELDQYLSALAIDGDDRIVVVGSPSRFDAFVVARYLPDGTLDPSFGSGGIVRTVTGPGTGALATHVLVDTDGTILVAGHVASAMTVMRHRPDGTLEDGFGTHGIASIDPDAYTGIGIHMALQADRRIVMAGHGALVRLNVDGTPDPAFGTAGVVAAGTDPMSLAVAIQPDGRIVTVGDYDSDPSSLQTGQVYATVSRYLAAAFDLGAPNPCEGECSRSVCGDGILASNCEQCDAGPANGTPSSCCSATCRLRTGPTACPSCQICGADTRCVAAPRRNCVLPARPDRSVLRIDDAAGARTDRLRWRWQNGRTFPFLDFGLQTVHGLAMCVYDASSATTPRLLLHARIPSIAECADASCWREYPDRLVYRDAGAATGGITNVLLRTGRRGDAAIAVSAGGPGLVLPELPLPLPLRVQLQSDNGRCWEERYDARSTGTNGAGRFRAVGAATP